MAWPRRGSNAAAQMKTTRIIRIVELQCIEPQRHREDQFSIWNSLCLCGSMHCNFFTLCFFPNIQSDSHCVEFVFPSEFHRNPFLPVSTEILAHLAIGH